MLSESPALIRATPQQEGIWFHSVVHGTACWNFVYVKSYEGVLHLPALKKALQWVIDRHGALRTNFRMHANQLYQVIHPHLCVDAVLEYGQGEGSTDDEMTRIADAETIRMGNYGFDLEREALLRCKVLQHGQRVFFLLAIHHIITDTVSMQVFWRELKAGYNACVRGEAAPGALPGRQYADFAHQLAAWQETEEYQTRKKYWLDKLSGELPALNLPFHRDQSKASFYTREMVLPTQLVRDAKSLALKKRVLYSSVFQLAYFILLRKYTGQRTLLVGNVVNGRGAGSRANDGVIGLFANRLVNVQQPGDDDCLAELLQRVHAETDRSLRDNIPYEDLMRDVNAKNRQGLALFKAAFNMVKRLEDATAFEGLQEQPGAGYRKALSDGQQYDIFLYVIDTVKDIRVRLELQCEEALAPLPDLVLDAYVQALHACVYNSGKKLSEVSIQGARENALCNAFNRTACSHPAGNAVLHELFRNQVKQHPDRVGLVFGNETLTYRALDVESDAVAVQLRQRGVGRGTLVGLLLHRSARMVSCLLGVLKAGAAYVPLDPAFPAVRTAYMLGDAGLDCLVTQQELLPKVPDQAKALLAEALDYTRAEPAPANANQPGDLCYVIYTSGSTGQPKGVMIEHQAVANFTQGITDRIDFRGKTIYALTTISFDIFVLESLLALCAGATVVMASESEQRDPSEAVAAIVRHRVQMLQATPSRMKMLLEGGTGFLAGLSEILVGGEAFPPDLLTTLRAKTTARIFNMYGPTETTVWSTMQELTRASTITAGTPINNTQVYILDENMHQQPMGAYGEVCIAGAGLARGYWGQPELSREKFVYPPFAPDAPVYRTGDVGRLLPGGLEIAGRKDDQVKIRGYRIELGEIECQLKRHPRVKDTVVVHKRNGQYEHLCAYYVSKQIINVQELRNYLRERLPEYMVPAYFVHLNAIPTTPNNKVDRAALKNNKIVSFDLDAYTGKMNGRLVAMWGKVLQIDNETLRTNLFSDFFDLGGHSLDAVFLLDDIRKEFNQTISLKEFFKFPTIHFLNDKITAVQENQPQLAPH